MPRDRKRHQLLVLGLILASCATARPKPSSKPELTCENLQNAPGSTELGTFLQVACDCGAGQSCELMAMLLEKEGGTENLRAAAEYRTRACRLGHSPACRPQQGAETQGSSASP